MQKLRNTFYATTFFFSFAASFSLALNIAAQPSDSPGSEIFERNEDGSFRVPKSMLDAAERRLAVEKDGFKKLQLLLRWVKIKEEFDKNSIFESEGEKIKKLAQTKNEIIDRIEFELPELYQSGVDVEQLFRELAFRYADSRNHERAIENFNRLKTKTGEDYLALGDALLSLEKINEAVKAYDEAGSEFRLKNIAAYKRAWAHMRQNEFERALVEFDLALNPNEHSKAQLLEEAFQDRVRPYLETFSKVKFEKNDAEGIRNLSSRVFPKDKEKAKALFIEGLKAIVQGFTAKSQIELAQDAFQFVTQEMKDATDILILSAPTWIKVYRGRLKHAEVSKIIESLPATPLDIDRSSALRAELNNTAFFYETYKENEADSKVSKDLLNQTYSRYFSLYPNDLGADDLRVNYGKILLEDARAKMCLDILSKRSRSQAETEAVSLSLEGKCRLKYLDQLYSEKHTDEFYALLIQSLLEEKIYLRENIGIPADLAFQGLSRMLTGAIAKNLRSEVLRSALKKLIAEYPYSKEEALFVELQITRAELEFKDLMDKKEKPSAKAEGFFEIYQNSPQNSDVAKKAITNSIVMANQRSALERCDEFRNKYRQSFTPGEGVFDRCVQFAEHFLEIETEYRYWAPDENKLNEAQILRVGLLELALGKKQGRARIESINSEESAAIIENWDGVSSKPKATDPSFQRIQKSAKTFLSSLSTVSFAQIQKIVPKKIDEFQKVDDAVVEYYQNGPEPLFMARSLFIRAEIAHGIDDWLSKLPPPPDLSEEEMAEYKKSSLEFLEPWRKKSGERTKECSELAYSLTPDFKETSTAFCKEDTSNKIYQDLMREWRKKIPRRQKLDRLFQVVFARAQAESDPLKARYLLFRALDLSKSETEKARAYLALAKLTNKERFWKNAAATDSSLVEPIEWMKEQVEGNPFFERLYSAQIRLLRASARN